MMKSAFLSAAGCVLGAGVVSYLHADPLWYFNVGMAISVGSLLGGLIHVVTEL